ncbi:hypothetical protein F8M41_023209 [Gigaspora margarita]|uniref:Uncharacterized protein n=1 Tax=Gigaspora margarita TaxID=4874 RepID=A0A8H4ADT6_GIGMA|nr:hypothetical protein F8M41_023209 [Gigaspora margarita]
MNKPELKINIRHSLVTKRLQKWIPSTTIERSHIIGIGIKWDKEPDTTNNLEHAYKVWKKKVEKLKTTQKFKNKDQKEPEKYK